MSGASELIVKRIRDGSVIDHIPAGRSLLVLKILGIKGDEGYRVALVMNVESRKIGRKDILKIEGRYISDSEASMITLIAPEATLNIVKNYRVVHKVRLKPPSMVRGIVKCPNSMCVSNNDPEAQPVFTLEKTDSREPSFRCIYCETRLTGSDALTELYG